MEAIISRVEKEKDEFITNLKMQSPEVIVESAYEIVIKENICMYLESMNTESAIISDDMLKALTNYEGNVLHKLYDIWCSNDSYTEYNDIKYVLDDFVVITSI